MIKKLVCVLQILFLATLISCNSDKNESVTYFGGRIINPKTNHVLLYSMEKIIDTFLLDTNNKFMGKINNANEGLYYFIHGNENQHIYIEPEDSLLLRLNTWDFDESLVFAGKGAERNNILIDCFLENEKDRKLFYDFNKLEAKNFKAKFDSLLNKKNNTYNHYIETHPTETKGFKEVLKVALTYPTYANVERYPIIYARYNEGRNFPKVDENFYDYRKNVNFNKDSLMYYSPYTRYIRNYVYNETYALGHKPKKNIYAYKFTVDLLKTIDEKVKSENFKNTFLRQTLVSHFYNKSNNNINSDAFDTFFKLSTNNDDKDLIKRFLSDIKAIPINQKLQDFTIIDYTNSKKSISKVIKNKKSFLLFWNSKSSSKTYIESRINFLSKKYPNINFIIIKVDGNSNGRLNKIDIKNQYYLDKSSKAHQFLQSYMLRTILVDKNGNVTNGYASISSNNLNSYLIELAKN